MPNSIIFLLKKFTVLNVIFLFLLNNHLYDMFNLCIIIISWDPNTIKSKHYDDQRVAYNFSCPFSHKDLDKKEKNFEWFLCKLCLGLL